MDISRLTPSTRTIEIKHPGDGNNLGIRVTIKSIDDPCHAELKRAIMDRSLHLQQRGKTLKAEEIEDNMRKLLFNTVAAWEWYNPTGEEGDDGYDPDSMADFEGEQPIFNLRNFKRVVLALPWFQDQINEEASERKLFFEGSNPS
jgi:hypothetical protein